MPANSNASTAAAVSLNHIERLTSENYSLWKLHMKMWLVSQDLWHVIEPGDADDKAPFDQKADSRALANLVLTLSEDQLVHVEDAKTALEAWNNLALVYDVVDTAKTAMCWNISPITKSSNRLQVI